MKVFPIWRSGLGDAWVSINYFLHLSLATNEEIRVHYESEPRRQLLQSIIDALDSVGSILLVPDKPTETYDPWNSWLEPYFPTIRHWRFHENHDLVSVAFDGVSIPEQKNLSKQEEVRAFAVIKSLLPDKKIIPVGKSLGISGTIDVLSRSVCFVGICSGCAHINHSVGCPAFLIEKTLPLSQVHLGKPYFRCSGVSDLNRHLQRYCGMLTDIKHPDMGSNSSKS